MMRWFLYVVALSTVASAFVTRELRPRQALEPSDVPSECTSICAPLFSEVQTCGSLNDACLCTSTIRDAGIVCADCIASVLPSTLQSLQAEADRSVEVCQQEGHDIAPITIVGVSPTTGVSGSGTTNTIVGVNPTGVSEPAAPSPTSPGPNSDSGTGSSGNPSGSGSGSSTNTPPKSGTYSLSEHFQMFFSAGLTMIVVLFGFY